MGNGHGMPEVFSLLELCFEQLSVESKAIVVRGYLDDYENLTCVICCDDLDGDGDCIDAQCPGPKSLTREELVERAKDAMYDNMNEAGFDVVSTEPLVMALNLLPHNFVGVHENA